MSFNSHYFNVKATVGAIITKREGNLIKVLLTRRGIPPYRGKWCLPGGHIEKSEPARDAVIREVKEEIGVDFDACFFGYFDEIIPKDDIHAVVLIFDGEVRGDFQAQFGEITEMNWFSREEITRLKLAFQHNTILEKYFEAQKP